MPWVACCFGLADMDTGEDHAGTPAAQTDTGGAATARSTCRHRRGRLSENPKLVRAIQEACRTLQPLPVEFRQVQHTLRHVSRESCSDDATFDLEYATKGARAIRRLPIYAGKPFPDELWLQNGVPCPISPRLRPAGDLLPRSRAGDTLRMDFLLDRAYVDIGLLNTVGLVLDPDQDLRTVNETLISAMSKTAMPTELSVHYPSYLISLTRQKSKQLVNEIWTRHNMRDVFLAHIKTPLQLYYLNF